MSTRELPTWYGWDYDSTESDSQPQQPDDNITVSAPQSPLRTWGYDIVTSAGPRQQTPQDSEEEDKLPMTLRLSRVQSAPPRMHHRARVPESGNEPLGTNTDKHQTALPRAASFAAASSSSHADLEKANIARTFTGDAMDHITKACSADGAFRIAALNGAVMGLVARLGEERSPATGRLWDMSQPARDIPKIHWMGLFATILLPDAVAEIRAEVLRQESFAAAKLVVRDFLNGRYEGWVDCWKSCPTSWWGWIKPWDDLLEDGKHYKKH
ncbi:hypothetical protein GGR50DRAFT_700638 [Xylaria sp. CBS 124048]|nr:hypothetical protein GGR50DRAFT_700638 [Xylaria sp. CBS 124048]